MITSETLCAYLDRELPAEEMERVRGAIAADRALAERLGQLASVDSLLVEFSREIDRQPLPASLQALLGGDSGATAPRADATHSGTVHAFPRGWTIRRPATLLALAATVIVAIVIGLRAGFPQLRDAELADVVRVGPVEPTSPLHHALERIPSGETYAASSAPVMSVTPVLSFESTRHEYCREFRAAVGTQAARGLACRRAGHWETLKLMAVPAGSEAPDEYEAASADSDEDFDALVDGLIADKPLGADAERALLDDQWRAP